MTVPSFGSFWIPETAGTSSDGAEPFISYTSTSVSCFLRNFLVRKSKYVFIAFLMRNHDFFPTCQVRVVRFYVSCLLLLPRPPPPPPPPLLLVLLVLLVLLLNCDPRRPVFSVGPQPRPSTPSVPCRTSTTTITASVPCRTSTTTIPAQCSLPDLNHDHPRPVFPAGPQPRVSTPSVPCRTSTATSRSQWALATPNGKNVRKDVR